MSRYQVAVRIRLGFENQRIWDTKEDRYLTAEEAQQILDIAEGVPDTIPLIDGDHARNLHAIAQNYRTTPNDNSYAVAAQAAVTRIKALEAIEKAVLLIVKGTNNDT